jgi:mRNA interferase MazF
MTHIPDRGDIITLNYDPATGREVGKTRPALVLSPKLYNRQGGLLLACAITTRVSGYPFEASLMAGGRVVGAVLADRINSLDWKARRAQLVERVPAAVLREVLAKLGTLIAG